MSVNEKIKNEKVQCDLSREAAKILAISSDKIDKLEYLAGEATLPSNQNKIKRLIMFTYSSLEKAFQKQVKITRSKENKLNSNKQLKSIKNFFTKDSFNEEAKKEIDRTKKEEQIIRDDLIYKTYNKKWKKKHDFQKFKMIQSFGREM